MGDQMYPLNVASLSPSIDCSMVQWLNLSAGKVGERRFESRSGIKISKSRMFFPSSLVKILYCGEPP